MRVAELKSLAREHGLRGYSRLRKAELIALLQNNPPPRQLREPDHQDLPDRLLHQLGLDQIDPGILVYMKWIYSNGRR